MSRSRGIALIAIAGGSILIPLNSTMLAVALPSIMAEFNVSAAMVSWLVTLYLASVALALPVSGSLGDRFGHRRMFVLGVAAFALTSLIGAVAWSFPVLVAARVLQAASGASISPNAASLVRTLAPVNRRGGTFGLFDMLISTSAATGPFVGGLLVSGLGWRSLFILAVPIALASASLATAIVPAARPHHEVRPPLDLAGLGLLSAALLALLIAISAARGGSRWEWWAAASPVLLGLFVRRELLTPVPAVDVRLFRVRPFAAAVAAVLGATIILHATLILIPILTQSLMRTSPIASGVVLLGISGISAIIAPFGGRLSDRLGRRAPAVTGSVFMALGLSALWLWTGQATVAIVGVLLALVGIGFGLSGSPRHTSAIESVPEHSTGMAAGAYYTSRYVGGVLGASLAGAVLASGVTTDVVASGFGVLALVAIGVTLLSLGLRGRVQTALESPMSLRIG